MASFLKDSGALAVGVALLVAILSRVIQAPMTPKALFALAVLLFLIGLGVRSLLKWYRSKHKSPARSGH
jgi:hypothetical protein